MHLQSIKKEAVQPFTGIRWDTYRKFTQPWLDLDGDNQHMPWRRKDNNMLRSIGAVLPALCLICKKKDRHITVSGKRKTDKRVQAETESAGTYFSKKSQHNPPKKQQHIRPYTLHIDCGDPQIVLNHGDITPRVSHFYAKIEA